MSQQSDPSWTAQRLVCRVLGQFLARGRISGPGLSEQDLGGAHEEARGSENDVPGLDPWQVRKSNLVREFHEGRGSIGAFSGDNALLLASALLRKHFPEVRDPEESSDGNDEDDGTNQEGDPEDNANGDDDNIKSEEATDGNIMDEEVNEADDCSQIASTSRDHLLVHSSQADEDDEGRVRKEEEDASCVILEAPSDDDESHDDDVDVQKMIDEIGLEVAMNSVIERMKMSRKKKKKK